MPTIIASNTIWSAGQTVVLTDDVQIAPGVTLTVEPGANVVGNNHAIVTFGSLVAVGTEAERINFNDTRFLFGNSNAPPGRMDIAFSSLSGGAFLPPSGGASYGSFSVTDSVFNHTGTSYVWYPTSESTFARNVFLDAGGLSVGTTVSVHITDNTFVGQGQININGTAAIVGWATYGSAVLDVSGNNFVDLGRPALEVSIDGRLTASNNYFETTNATEINQLIIDRNDDLSRPSYISSTSISSSPSDASLAAVSRSGLALVLGTASSDTLVSTRLNDVLHGGAGADTYVVDSLGDVVVERAGHGLDTVLATASHDLGAGMEIEVLRASDPAALTALRLAGNEFSQTIVGNAGANTLLGLGGDDVLTGGLGQDIISGGAGSDRFVDTAAGLSGDTITDWTVDDRIVISDANLASFTLARSGNVLTFTGGSITLANASSGQLFYQEALGGGVEIRMAADVRNDFNGDGRSDVVWLHTSGAFAGWLGQADGSFLHSGRAANPVDPSWSIVGAGDVNGDGRDDLIWRHSGGALAEWLGQRDGSFINNGAAATTVDTSWTVVGTGDFNGDGRSDIVWSHTSGAFAGWLGQADGSFLHSGRAANPVDVSWHVVATGDFNGDGADDLLWRHSGGSIAEWLGQADGSFINNGAGAFALNSSWTVLGAGDFNGDGRSDILARNASGLFAEWLGQSSGGFAQNTSVSNVVAPEWHVAAIGDYNGDGRDDLIMRHQNGGFTEFLAQWNGSFVHSASADYTVDATWVIQSPDIHLL